MLEEINNLTVSLYFTKKKKLTMEAK